MLLYEPNLHEPLFETQWSADIAKAMIRNIVEDCLSKFQQEKLWSVHPDIEKTYGITKALTGLWLGAAGTIWGLEQLMQADSTLPQFDFKPFLNILELKQSESLKEFSPPFLFDPDAPGYLFGYSGIHLLHWSLMQDNLTLEKLKVDITRNKANPANELMWAAPGTMLAAWFLYQKTGQAIWATLFQDSATHLFASWQYDPKSDCKLWTQDMYGSQNKYLGLVHGFAGNIGVLSLGIDLLNKEQKDQLIIGAQDTLMKTAYTNDKHANWLPSMSEAWPGSHKFFLQLCHGAPSMLIGFSPLWPYLNQSARTVFLKAAALIWDAGPLKKPWGLCHGTAGNGYVFLKCYHLTGDSKWLERARAFAMHAIAQSKKQQTDYGCIRTDNWCGDVGLALYLKDCINQNSQFPLWDYFF